MTRHKREKILDSTWYLSSLIVVISFNCIRYILKEINKVKKNSRNATPTKVIRILNKEIVVRKDFDPHCN